LDAVFPTETQNLVRMKGVSETTWDYVISRYKDIEHHRPVASGTSGAARAVTNQPNKRVRPNSSQPGHTQGSSSFLFLPLVEEVVVVVVVVVVTVVVTVEAVLEVEVIQALEDRGIHPPPENAMFVSKKAILWPITPRFKFFGTSSELLQDKIAIIHFRVRPFRARPVLLIRAPLFTSLTSTANGVSTTNSFGTLTTFLLGITGATGINDSGLADTEFLDEDDVYMGHSFMVSQSNDDAFEPNNWVYDTGTCRNLVNTKDSFINYTPFPSPKIFSSANGTIVRAHGCGPVSEQPTDKSTHRKRFIPQT
jgi:hypothetical protein